jgi:hypothetical protein
MVGERHYLNFHEAQQADGRDPRLATVECVSLFSYLCASATVITGDSVGSWTEYIFQLGTEFYVRKYCYFVYISSKFKYVYTLKSYLCLFFLCAGILGLY